MSDISVKRTTFNGRRGMRIQNDILQLVMLQGGGHIADISIKENKINPMWVPKWESVEPYNYNADEHEEAYGGPGDAKLLCGIMGHNICLDIFGVSSPEEQSLGITTHGEAPALKWELSHEDGVLTGNVSLPVAELDFTRRVEMKTGSRIVRISETVANKKKEPHLFGWCQHVTLGEPFLVKGETVFDMPAVWGKTFTADFSEFPRLEPDREFIWPTAPGSNGKNQNLRFVSSEEKSGDFSAQLMDPSLENGWFTAYSPEHDILIGYVWKRTDFPWLGNWEENFSRDAAPWNGAELTRGMEFSTSPFPTGKQAAIDLGTLNNVPTFRKIEPEGSLSVCYHAFILDGLDGYQGTDSLDFDGEKIVLKSGNKTVEID